MPKWLLGRCLRSAATDGGRDVRTEKDSVAVVVELREDGVGPPIRECGGEDLGEGAGCDHQAVLLSLGAEPAEERPRVLQREDEARSAT